MLPLTVKEGEYWDPVKEEFSYTKPYDLTLEHSLVSISKWEAKWHISFFATKLTGAMLISYIKCMTLNKNVPDEVYHRLTDKDIRKILEYIHDPMTASSVTDLVKHNTRTQKQVTSELVYYWMAKLNIPVEFEKWHLNRLIMLIRIAFAEENPQKMNQRETAAYYNSVIERNRAKMHK